MADTVKYAYQLIGSDGSVLHASQYDYDDIVAASDAAEEHVRGFGSPRYTHTDYRIIRQDGKPVTSDTLNEQPTEQSEPTKPER